MAVSKWLAIVLATRPELSQAAVGPLLEPVVEAALAAWPTVGLEPSLFVAHLLERLPAGVPLEPALRSLHASDLYLACACAHGNPRAVALFERQFFAAVEGTVARINRSTDFRDELRQRLRERLLVGAPARIADYNGLGPLEGWLRVAATRLALNLQRETKRNARLRPDIPRAQNPELDIIHQLYRPEVEAAFRGAFVHLAADDRELLRLHYVDALTFEQLGERLGCDRSTASRRMAATRRLLLEETRREFERLVPAVTTASRDSLLVALRSQIDLNLASVLES